MLGDDAVVGRGISEAGAGEAGADDPSLFRAAGLSAAVSSKAGSISTASKPPAVLGGGADLMGAKRPSESVQSEFKFTGKRFRGGPG